MIEFKAWPKTPRLFRDVVITEKIDGTNAAVQIIPVDGDILPVTHQATYTQDTDGAGFLVAAQSRKRVITPDDDNAGFARWVYDNARTLVKDLGPGTHFGEWWGQGIQRRYDMDHKRFSLFNTGKWYDAQLSFNTPRLGVVPVLYEGPFSEEAVQQALMDLRIYGSFATKNFFNKPEGIVIYHKAADQVFKVLLENDELPKGLVST